MEHVEHHSGLLLGKEGEQPRRRVSASLGRRWLNAESGKPRHALSPRQANKRRIVHTSYLYGYFEASETQSPCVGLRLAAWRRSNPTFQKNQTTKDCLKVTITGISGHALRHHCLCSPEYPGREQPSGKHRRLERSNLEACNNPS